MASKQKNNTHPDLAFITILIAKAAACVIEKIVCYVTCVEEKRNTHRILVEKCEGM